VTGPGDDEIETNNRKEKRAKRRRQKRCTEPAKTGSDSR
jgi:hypothetical protein